MMASGSLRDRSSRNIPICSNSPLGSGSVPMFKEKSGTVVDDMGEVGVGGRGCVWGTEARDYR